MKNLARFFSFLMITLTLSSAFGATQQWSADAANAWYQKQGWMVGSNYIPADAINQLEMWQKETFNPGRIDWELSLAQKAGLTTVRVFLHDLMWQNDASGFVSRIETFLAIASRHHIRPVFVLFDSCWNPHPHWGTQPAPTPGVHNSGWVQSPGTDALADASQVPRLRSYVQGVIQAFAGDTRILAWDLWNEPDNTNDSSSHDSSTKLNAITVLLPQVFAWARAANPSQPLTSGVWSGDWSATALNPIQQTQLSLSDIISFHNYDPAAPFEARIQSLLRFHRPIFCTEYMARPLGSTIQTILPVAKRYGVSALNWGFVAGKTQTYYPWDSWQHPYSQPPQVWFHDLFYPNGVPFSIPEISFIQSITKAQGQ